MQCLTRGDVKTRDKQPALELFEFSEGRGVMLKAIETEEFLDLIGDAVDADVKSKGKMAIALVKYGVCDESGARLFETNDEVVGTLAIDEIARAANRITELSGLMEDPTKKNSTIGNSSPSG